MGLAPVVQVCADRFSNEAALVACRQLGLSGLGVVASPATFGPGSGPVLLDNVQCLGNETSLADCKHAGLGVHNCQHSEDVGISCVYQPSESSSPCCARCVCCCCPICKHPLAALA